MNKLNIVAAAGALYFAGAGFVSLFTDGNPIMTGTYMICSTIYTGVLLVLCK